MPDKKGKGPHKQNCPLSNEQFNDLFTRAIRGELNNIDDPRGGYTARGGYRKVPPQPGPGPFHGETTHYGLDDIGQGKAEKK